MLFFEPVGLFAVHSVGADVIDEFVLVQLDNNLFVLFFLFLDADEFVFVLNLSLSFFGYMVVGKHLDGLLGCDFGSVGTVVLVIEVELRYVHFLVLLLQFVLLTGEGLLQRFSYLFVL